MSKILFLGGTCNGDDWRSRLIPKLEKEGIKYFNPVVPDWTPECIEIENQIKNDPNTFELYWITSAMNGVYSIAEAVDASNKKPKRTIFGVGIEGFSIAQLKSLNAVGELIHNNGAWVVGTFGHIVEATRMAMR